MVFKIVVPLLLLFLPFESFAQLPGSETTPNTIQTKSVEEIIPVIIQPVAIIKEGVIVYDSEQLKLKLNLTKRQDKKIQKYYISYIKDQLKVKQKLVSLSYKFKRISLDKNFDEFENELLLDKIFKLKSELFLNNVMFVSKVKEKMKKSQIKEFNNSFDFVFDIKL